MDAQLTPTAVVTSYCPSCGEGNEKTMHMLFGGQDHDIRIPMNCACTRRQLEEESLRDERLRLSREEQRLADARKRRNGLLAKHGFQTLLNEESASFDTWAPETNISLKESSMAFCNDAAFRIKNGYGLALIGGVRYGKSFALQCIARNLVFEQGYAVAIARQADYLKAIRHSFDSAEVLEHELFALLGNVDVLIIDELGFGKVSQEWGLPTLFSIIDTAYDANTPIIVASNYTEKQLSKIFNDAVLGEDRITPRILEKAETFIVSEHSFSLEKRRETTQIIRHRRNA